MIVCEYKVKFEPPLKHLHSLENLVILIKSIYIFNESCFFFFFYKAV